MNRCAAFAEKLTGRYAVIHKSENMRYLTGYTGEGCVFVRPDGTSVIVTDFRYTEQASQQAPESGCEMTKAGRGELVVLAELAKEVGEGEILVETDHLSHDHYVKLEEALAPVKLVPQGHIVEKLRSIKDASEISAITKACEISCKAFDRILTIIKPGMTEREIQIALDYEMLKLGADGIAFSTIVAAGEHGSLPHAIPGDRVVNSGEFVTMDFGAAYQGYCSDMTRTVAVGHVSDELRKMYNDVLTAQLLALDAVKPGVNCFDVDKVARDYLDARYPGCFGHGLGHAVGLLIHEEPRFSPMCHDIVTPGHVLTVEPGVYIPGVGGVRIEDSIIITPDGFLNPITAPKELIEL